MFGHTLYPYLYDVLIAVGYGLMLPQIAILHVRHRQVRQSGAILGTIAGTAAVAVGLGGSVNVDLRPAALFLLGIWWWTIGKMWAETRVLPASLGLATASLGVVAFAGVVVESASVLSGIVPGYPAIEMWTLMRLALGAWLVGLALPLNRLK
jgi:hypothetical protein